MKRNNDKDFIKINNSDIIEDSKIISLFFNRDETALRHIKNKYERYLFKIAFNILDSKEDSDECLNDAFLHAWNSIPPNKPRDLCSFLGKITRNLAIDRYRKNTAKKRYSNMSLALDELSDITLLKTIDPSPENDLHLKSIIDSFLSSLPKQTRIIFVRRYWYLYSVGEIAADLRLPVGTVKSILSRTRKRFCDHLTKEGIEV